MPSFRLGKVKAKTTGIDIKKAYRLQQEMLWACAGALRYPLLLLAPKRGCGVSATIAHASFPARQGQSTFIMIREKSTACQTLNWGLLYAQLFITIE